MTKPELVNTLHAKLEDGTLTPQQFYDAIESSNDEITTDEVISDDEWMEGATLKAAAAPEKSTLQTPTKTFIRSVGIKQLKQAIRALGIATTNVTKPELVNTLHAKLEDGTLTPQQFYDAIESPTDEVTADEVTTDNPWAGCTLIVCPVSVICNWVQQIEQHVVPGTLRVATYRGRSKTTTAFLRYEISHWSTCRS